MLDEGRNNPRFSQIAVSADKNAPSQFGCGVGDEAATPFTEHDPPRGEEMPPGPRAEQ